MSTHEVQDASAQRPNTKRDNRQLRNLRWALIGIFGITAVLLYSFPPLFGIQFIALIGLLFVIAVLHGAERYGTRNLTAFFLISSAVSLLFEVLTVERPLAPSVSYHYSMPLVIPGLGVPLTVIFAYFGAGYFSWMLSHVLTRQYSAKLEGKWIFAVPFIATFILVMWDLGLDPVFSTVYKQWVWQSPGPYYGVPLTNYCGWFILVFIFYQLFALFLTKYDRIQPQKMSTLSSKSYWTQAAVTYGLLGLSIIAAPLSNPNDITLSMALVTIFTMIFVAIISFITIMNNHALS